MPIGPAWPNALGTSGGGGVTDHGDLTGLGDDDHTQYLLAAGSRALTGDWDVGAQDITNVAQLGIGVATAVALLHLQDGASTATIPADVNAWFDSSGPNFGAITGGPTDLVGWLFGDSVDPTAGRFLYDNQNNAIQLFALALERFRLDVTGVRIEPGGVTAAASHALHLFDLGIGGLIENQTEQTDDGGHAIVGVIAGGLGGGSGGTKLVMRTHGPTYVETLLGTSMSGACAIIGQPTNNGLVIGTITDQPLIFGTNNIKNVTINTTGQMDIAAVGMVIGSGSMGGSITGFGINIAGNKHSKLITGSLGSGFLFDSSGIFNIHGVANFNAIGGFENPLFSMSGTGDVIIGSTSVTPTATARFTVKGAGTSTGVAVLVEDSAGTDRIQILDNGLLHCLFDVEVDGNVGIKQSNPSTALQVDGIINIEDPLFGLGHDLAANESPKFFANFGLNIHGSVILSQNVYYDNTALKSAQTHAAISGAAITIPGSSQTRAGEIEFWTTPVGAVTAGDAYDQSNPRMVLDNDGNLVVGAVVPGRRFHVVVDRALTSTIQQLFRLTHTTSGTPANGIGLGIEFEQETAAGNNEIIAGIQANASSVTATSEEGELVLLTMGAGAAMVARVRIDSTGTEFAGNVGFNATSPLAVPAAYTITNPVSRRSFDTTTVTLPQLAEVVGTLIQDLINYGLLQ